LVAQVLSSSDGADSEQDSQPAAKRPRRVVDSDSYTCSEGGGDEVMEDAPAVQSTPKQQRKQETPSWVAERVATRLAAEELVVDVQGEQEEGLFMELLPQFASGSSSSSSSINPLRVPANSVDFRGMADAWNQ